MLRIGRSADQLRPRPSGAQPQPLRPCRLYGLSELRNGPGLRRGGPDRQSILTGS